MEIILNREQAMKAVDVARNFAQGASGLKVLVRPEVAFDE
jgi:stage V sporulation protein SpoVS